MIKSKPIDRTRYYNNNDVIINSIINNKIILSKFLPLCRLNPCEPMTSRDESSRRGTTFSYVKGHCLYRKFYWTYKQLINTSLNGIFKCLLNLNLNQNGPNNLLQLICKIVHKVILTKYVSQLWPLHIRVTESLIDLVFSCQRTSVWMQTRLWM